MFDEDSKPLRWFLLPSEAANCLKEPAGNQTSREYTLPFCPPSVREQLGLPPFEEQFIEEKPTDTDMLDSNRLSGILCDLKKAVKRQTLDNEAQERDKGHSVILNNTDPEKDTQAQGDSVVSLKTQEGNDSNSVIGHTDAVCCDSENAKNLCASNPGNDQCCIRKRGISDADLTPGDSKKPKEEGEGRKGKKKAGLQWYSPPKAVFTPFLKVC